MLDPGATVVTTPREVAADEAFDGMVDTVPEEADIITLVRFPVPEVVADRKFEQPATRFALEARDGLTLFGVRDPRA